MDDNVITGNTTDRFLHCARLTADIKTCKAG